MQDIDSQADKIQEESKKKADELEQQEQELQEK